VRLEGATALRGTLRTPGDKSVSHRALLIGALAEGTSRIEGLSDGEDVACTRRAVEALGVAVERVEGGLTLAGGRSRLHAPTGPIDCGNSGTGMRLLAGLVAASPWRTELRGDASLSSRPMDRVAEPLRAMGARVRGRTARCLPPLVVDGSLLQGVTWEPPMASAQVKSAILLAGLGADGETVVCEAVPTRAHTEEMLEASGADIVVEPWRSGKRVVLRPGPLRPRTWVVPGDPSQAAFWIVAACVVPDSAVRVDGVYGGPSRLGFVEVLRRMGARVDVWDGPGGAVTLAATAGPLEATKIRAEEIPSLDEVPILAVAAACAAGRTVFADVGELRVKEVDRLAAVVRLLEAFGVEAEVEGDELRVQGVGPTGALTPGRFRSEGDHRMAMAAAVAALAAGPGESVIEGFEAVATSYPGFLADLEHLRAGAAGDAHRDGLIVAIDGPAGSGKSTVSRALARRLGWARLDTGAMYRAVAWRVLRAGIAPADGPAVAALAEASDIVIDDDTVHIDGVDVTRAIRSREVSATVSAVAANPGVRAALVARQRRWAAEHGGGVVEGRDIGTVVFPGAALKVYLTATVDERARRRDDEAPEGLVRRDHLDSTRAASPLAVAEDARVIDTTDRSVEDVVEELARWL
jgi:3-phosphoshikimate 1-carboxyvinyltransferase